MKWNITDEEIAQAFQNTNFGEGANHRKILEQGILKRIAGYRNGGTLNRILFELGLITSCDAVTKKGRMFLFVSFYDRSHT